jgi:hypothetical protein
VIGSSRCGRGAAAADQAYNDPLESAMVPLLVLLELLSSAEVESWRRPHRPQYVLFTDCPFAGAGGYPFTGNLSADAASLRALPDVIGMTMSADGRLVIGCEFPFSLMQDEVPMAEKERRLRALLAASVATKIPISVVRKFCRCTTVASVCAAREASSVLRYHLSVLTVDGQNYWTGNSTFNLWNFWNISLPGYNPANINNVEWTRPNDPTSAVKLGWRNWGAQARVTPEQNILSPMVKAVFGLRLTAMARILADFVRAGHKDLLGTVKVGWEAGLEYNAYYYKQGNDLVNQPPANDPITGLDWDCRKAKDKHCTPAEHLAAGQDVALLGYAAAKSAGLTPSGPAGVLTGVDAAKLTVEYVSWCASTVVAAGVPADIVSNHVGGQVPPYKAVGYEAGFMAEDIGYPGFSFYWGPANNPSTGFPAAMKAANRTKWACAEWQPPGDKRGTMAGWLESFQAQLSFLDCAHLSVYDNAVTTQPHTVAAVRALLKGGAPWRTEVA